MRWTIGAGPAQYPNRQPVLCLLEIKDSFTLAAALFLLPMKHLFNIRMFDDGHPLIKIEEPLDHIGNGIQIDLPARITLQDRTTYSFFRDVILALRSAVSLY